MIKVLIVENDPMVRKINEEYIERMTDIEVINSVSTIEEAKIFLKKNNPDIILLDLLFPEEDGLDLLKWILLKDIIIDIILITAENKAQTVEKTFRLGVTDYLIKPYSYERFNISIERYKKKRKIIKANLNLNQIEIDKLMINNKLSLVDKNIEDQEYGKNTYDKIMEYINHNSSISYTANEVAEQIGVSRITARRYLDLLEENGFVEVKLEYGKVGRPKNKYKLKESFKK